MDKVSLKGLDHAIACTVVDGKIYIRLYSVRFKKSGSKVPLVSMQNMGPFWDLTVRRTQLPSEDLWKLACKQPKMYETFYILFNICFSFHDMTFLSFLLQFVTERKLKR